MKQQIPDITEGFIKQLSGLDLNERELIDNEQDITKYASIVSSDNPPISSKSPILDKIAQLQYFKDNRKSLTLEELPNIEQHRNYLDWNELVKHIPLPEDYNGIFMHPLVISEQREIYYIVVDEEVPEEVHTDLKESFILLDGSCTCHITDEQGNNRNVHMSEGDYMDFGIGEHHDVCITSREPGRAILQWIKE